jgi:predicted transcriptional regulator of viral defense system
MYLTQAIQGYAPIPIPHHVMIGLLKDYVNPNNKIYELVKRGILERVTKGLYIAGSALQAERPDPFLLANQILGPSYVSVESALSYYGLIPERVYTTTSMTTKAARHYTTPVGAFTYIRLSLPYYSFGVRSVQLTKQQTIMMASPEKALLDKIITTAGVEFRSRTAVLSYLESDLRVDIDNLKQFDKEAMQNWLSHAPKKRTLMILIEAIQTL